MTTQSKLFAYIKENFGIEPDYPFKEDDVAIFRHRGNRKWFAAAILRLEKKKLGIAEEGICNVVNLKCHPILSGSYRTIPGIFPAYHMNKEHWITVLLDGSVDADTVWELVNISYNLTVSSSKRKSNPA